MLATSQPRRVRALSLLVLFCVLVLGLNPGPAVAADALRAVATSSAPGTPAITVDPARPAIIKKDAGFTVSGTFRNDTGKQINAGTAHIGLSGDLLDTTQAVQNWYSGKSQPKQLTVATGTLGSLAPGASASFSINVPAAKISWKYALASLPMTITVTEGASLTQPATLSSLRTTAQMQRESITGPLQVNWVVPLTLPANPALFGPSGTARDNAWTAAIGPGSRIDQLITALADQPITWVIDPLLLDPPTPADDNVPATQITSLASATATQAPVADDVATILATTLLDRLGQLPDNQTIWWTGYDDPDLTALTALGKPGTDLLNRELSRPLPQSLRQLSTTRVMWPAADVSGDQVTGLNTTFRTASGQAPLTLLPRRSVVDDGSAITTSLRQVSGTGGVLLYHEALSSTVSATGGDPGAQAARFMADTIAVYQQSPGSRRSLTVVAPRSGGAVPAQLAATIKAIRSAAWIADSTGDALTAGLATAQRSVLLPKPGRGQTFPTQRVTYLSSDLVDRRIGRQRDRIRTLGSVLVDSNDFVIGRSRTLDVISSTRWRGAPSGLMTTSTTQSQALRALTGRISVNPTAVNFFADSGSLSVTIVNDLNRAIHDIQLNLRPRLYILRIPKQPDPIQMRANSRSVVRTEVAALAPGRVAVDAVVTAPGGIALGDPGNVTQLNVNVRPTSTWIYWVLGIVGGLVLVFGLLRSLRKGPRRRTLDASSTEPTPADAIVDAGTGDRTQPSAQDVTDPTHDAPTPEATPPDDDVSEH